MDAGVSGSDECTVLWRYPAAELALSADTLAILRAVQSLRRRASKNLYCFLKPSRIFSYLLEYADISPSHAHTFTTRTPAPQVDFKCAFHLQRL